MALYHTQLYEGLLDEAPRDLCATEISSAGALWFRRIHFETHGCMRACLMWILETRVELKFPANVFTLKIRMIGKRKFGSQRAPSITWIFQANRDHVSKCHQVDLVQRVRNAKINKPRQREWGKHKRKLWLEHCVVVSRGDKIFVCDLNVQRFPAEARQQHYKK